jgi:hypothetical protein
VTSTVIRVSAIIIGIISAIWAASRVFEVAAFAAIGYGVISGYLSMRDKIDAEREKTLSLQSKLDTAELMLEKHGLPIDDGPAETGPAETKTVRKRSLLQRALG